MTIASPILFALSLLKCLLDRRKGFDKLSPNGVGGARG